MFFPKGVVFFTICSFSITNAERISARRSEDCLGRGRPRSADGTDATQEDGAAGWRPRRESAPPHRWRKVGRSLGGPRAHRSGTRRRSPGGRQIAGPGGGRRRWAAGLKRHRASRRASRRTSREGAPPTTIRPSAWNVIADTAPAAAGRRVRRAVGVEAPEGRTWLVA